MQAFGRRLYELHRHYTASIAYREPGPQLSARRLVQIVQLDLGPQLQQYPPWRTAFFVLQVPGRRPLDLPK